MFASDLDPASRAQLAKGARLVELLKQKQAAPFPVEEQVVSIWAGTTGQLDAVAVEDVRRFEAEFLDYLRRSKNGPARRDPRDQQVRGGAPSRRLEAEVVTFKHQAPPAAPVPTASEAESRRRRRRADADRAGRWHVRASEQIVKQKR